MLCLTIWLQACATVMREDLTNPVSKSRDYKEVELLRFSGSVLDHIELTYHYVINSYWGEPHCYVANRGKRNALWCVRTRNFSTVIKIPSPCDRNFYQFVVNLPIVFPSSQLLRQFAWLRISQDASHFARHNLLAELVEQ